MQDCITQNIFLLKINFQPTSKSLHFSYLFLNYFRLLQIFDIHTFYIYLSLNNSIISMLILLSSRLFLPIELVLLFRSWFTFFNNLCFFLLNICKTLSSYAIKKIISYNTCKYKQVIYQAM